ncbi:nuclease-related domain-containing protein [Microbispora sp. H10949]|uniref:nuclease-related domain-containing protein n=1 Tax=Microbispora sp. H10949 TaxID=2729111 RepID=UPI001602D634|nr:nuclease-related domain-containing protein [Microbispora sp. H10949]
MARIAPSSGAGASAHARYRQEWAADRTQRLLVRGGLALAVAVVLAALIDWRAGLAGGALAALADTVYRWRTHEAVRTWRRGALGERRTARRLRLLSTLGYAVLHDRRLPHGRANVDHLVIGPTGVFVLDSKQWRPDAHVRRARGGVRRGRVFTDADTRALIYEARAVSRALTAAYGARVEAVPILAVHGPHVPRKGITLSSGTHVLRPSLLATWILRYGPRLDRDEVTRLQQAAERAFPPYL